MQLVLTKIRTDGKNNFEKKQAKAWKITQHAIIKEAFDANAISVIRRRAVKCPGETAQLLRITCAFFGHSSNKYFILMGGMVINEDSNEFDRRRILTGDYNVGAHIYTQKSRNLAYWIVASACVYVHMR